MYEQLPPPAGYERIPTATSADTVDVADLVRTLRRQWRAVMAFLAVGVLAAAAVVLFAPRRFEGKATLLARPSATGTSIASRLGGIGELLGGLGPLGNAGEMETELQMLRSRALAGEVVDSLQLQFRVREPSGVAPLALVAASHLPGSFAPRTYEFHRAEDGSYRTTRDGRTYVLWPGRADSLDIGVVTLREGALPQRIALKVEDREDAITRAVANLTATKAGGDIARIVYRGEDSLTAATAANVLIASYLERRRTTDRGTNQRRVEYVGRQLDSTRAELTRVEQELRRYQESSGVLDAGVVGQVELEAAAELRLALTELQVDEGAIRRLLAEAENGRIAFRDLAGHPVFVRGSAMSALVNQLSELEVRRLALLERRTERDPEVIAVDSTMRALETNVLSMARSYADAVTRQREQMQAKLTGIQDALLALPAAAERGGRLQRDVQRLTQISTALEAQLVEARLGAIGEGGEVRQIDVAMPQRKPSFPRPFLTMGIGTAGGLVAGLIAALFLGWFGRWLRDPVEIERAIGISAQRFEPNAPLLMAGAAANARSLLVVPLDRAARAGAATVAERLVRTAQQRALPAFVAQLGEASTSGNGGAPVDAASITTIDQMEQQGGMPVVCLPELSSDVTLAALRETRPVVLVAPPGPVDRTRLAHAVDTLRRLQVPCAGVVISDLPGSRTLI